MTPERKAEEEQVARVYADGILRGNINWPLMNEAIIERWSVTALGRIKQRAWRLVAERWSDTETAGEAGDGL